MNFSAILVDDEELAIRRLRRLLKDEPGIEILDTAAGGREAVEKIEALKPDVVFLDIQMPGWNGFEVLRRLQHAPTVIFTTAYDEYALRAFEENSVDYLLKPVEKPRLAQAIAKLKRLRETPGHTQTAIDELRRLVNAALPEAAKPEGARISAKVGDRLLVFEAGEIACFVAEEKLTLAIVGDKEYAVDYTLDELEKKLPAHRFLRVHRSGLVNLDAIREIRAWFGGKLLIQLKTGKRELIVSRQRAQALRRALSL